MGLGCGQHQWLTSCLFVLAAFFVAAAILATCLAALIIFLAALLAAGCPIVLRISPRRMLTATFAGTLFHTLLSLSVVCHKIFLPFVSCVENSGRSVNPPTAPFQIIKVCAIQKIAEDRERRRHLALNRDFKPYNQA